MTLLLLTLGACVGPRASPDTAAAAEAASLVGKHFWETQSVPLGEPCRRPMSPLCSAAGQGFTVESVTTGIGGDAFVRVRLDDGSEGYLPYFVGTRRIAWTSEDPAAMRQARDARLGAIKAAIAEMERQYCTGGTLQIGMTERAAVRAWCFPDRATSIETAKGTREEWVYPHQGTLYFKDGRLTEIRRLD